MVLSLRTHALAASLSLCLITGACVQATPEARTSPAPSVAIPNTQVRQLTSSISGREYDLYVHLPGGYEQNTEKQYPVLYVLDGQWDFKLLASVYGGLVYDEFVPEMIIVGITYSGAEPDYGALRAIDYTPAPAADLPDSGGAREFLAFLKGEAIPFVEANYRADASDRVLLDSSLGGLFTLYTMFAEPELFTGYVAASPAVPYAQNLLFQREAEFARTHGDLPVRLFLSVGEVEELAGPVQEFAGVLQSRGYPGLRLESRVIEGERHAGNKPEAYNRGVRFTFPCD